MPFTTASGFYAGVFYSVGSPLYKPSDSDDETLIYGVCFVPIGQGSSYRGFLFQTAELREDYYLYA